MSSPTPELEIKENFKSLFIRAGAGAGKTTQLIATFMQFSNEFYAQKGRYPKVVITTFTRKATQEVKERLLLSALKNGDKNIFEHINKKSFVSISTIHGLLNLFVTQNAEALSLPQEIQIVDQAQSDRFLRKTMHALLKVDGKYIDLLESHSFSRLLELTRTGLDLCYQNKELRFVGGDELLQLTESKVRQVLEKLGRILETVVDVPEKWMGYFIFLNSYRQLILERKLEQAIQLLEDSPKKPSFSEKKPPFQPEVNSLIDEVRKDEFFIFQDTEAYRKQHQTVNQLFFEFLIKIFEKDQEFKKKSGQLTISDLENYSLRLVGMFPRETQSFSEAWDFFMIDEYQDTSPLQVKLLNAIIKDKPCFIVGDPQQSIYLFRGARSEVFEKKEKEFLQTEKGEVRSLNINYRSDPRLMSFINDFFNGFTQKFQPMKLKSDLNPSPIEDQVFFRQAYDQSVAALKHIRHLMNSGVSAKDIAVISRKNSALRELAHLAHRFHVPVQLQISGGFENQREVIDLVSFLNFLANPYDSQNLIVLLRSPWLQIDDQSLVGISSSSEQRQPFWTALLSATETTTKVENVRRLLLEYLSDFSKLGVSLTLNKFLVNTGFLFFSEAIDSSGQREANIWKLVTLLREAERRAGFSLTQFLQDQFQSLQSDLGSTSVEAQPVVQPDRVSLMTVHASKGLEFRHVIVIGMSDRPSITNTLDLAFDSETQKLSLSVYDATEGKALPSRWSIQCRKQFNQRELLESERLLYVAMTRAKASLCLIAQVPPPQGRSAATKDSWSKKMSWPTESGFVQINPSHLPYQVVVDYELDAKLDPIAKERKVSSSVRLPFDPSLEKKFEFNFDSSRKSIQQSSVTGLLTTDDQGKAGDSVKFSAQTMVSALKKAQRGTELHRLFESLRYNAADRTKNGALSKEEVNLAFQEEKMLNYLLNLDEIDLLKILRAGHVEWGFGLRLPNGSMLQGQIDAWAEVDDTVYVIDYKTGSDRYLKKAFDQLAIYSYALLKMNQISGSSRLMHLVIYPAEEKIEKKIFANCFEFMELKI